MNHVIITGTGRAGTSFLVLLLTRLGLDTGYTFDQARRYMIQPHRAGLEWTPKDGLPKPYILKAPSFCLTLRRRLDEGLKLDRVIVPIRDLHQAAASRIEIGPFNGGLWNVQDAPDQFRTLAHNFHQLMLTLADAEVPVTLIAYPRLTLCPAYLFRKLLPLLDGRGYDEFEVAHNECVDPSLSHRYPSP